MEPLTDLGVSIASDATHSLLSKIKKNIRYLFKYKDNLDNLKVATDQLEAKRTDASRLLDDSNNKLKDLSATVYLWRTQANELCNKAHDIISKNSVSCLHLWSRYSLSKMAWEATQEINQKVEKAPNFGTTFGRPTQKLGDTFNLKGFMEFESRLKLLDEVLKVLKDDEVSMCSICGMGGIGKTMSVKKLIQRVELDYLFDKVAMVTVSQVPNLEKIQQEIIEQLGLKMDEVTMRAKGKKLNTWLTNNNTLLILDDVWWQLSDEDFENVGIPLGGKRCKIVLTSRNEDECRKTGSQKNFSIGVLEHEEAWYFFRLIAGKCAEDMKLKDTAKKISYECDGLPIVIVAIATALKDKPPGIWNDALQRLRNSNLQKISGMEKVYSRLELSYNLLNDKEAQSCFLLCCLFPEDHDVSIEDLVFYGKGLELFENVDSISEARNRVEAIIDKLKKRFLLLDGEVGCVRMHDIIRDFAISISSTSYLTRHGKEMIKWPEARFYENCSAISLTYDNVKLEDPIFLRCPKLKLLRLCFGANSTGLPMGIFEGTKELKLLILDVPSIEQPLSMLKELRILIINESWVQDREKPLNIGDLIGHGDLRNLEILKIYTMRPCNDFPMEIGLLSNLKILDFPIWSLVYIPPGVLSKLVKLEELLLPWKFISWGCKEDDGERVNASLDEIESLPLTRVEFGIKESSSLGEKFVKNLKRFNILIGSPGLVPDFSEVEIDSATLRVANVDASTFTVNWIISFLKKSEHLILEDVRNLKNLMFLPPSLQLKKIELQSCNEIECFIDKTVKESCFSNLRDITLFYSRKMLYMFPLPVARELRQLQKMLIRGCYELKECFSKDDNNRIEEENVARNDVAEVRKILLPQLKELELQDNIEFRAFYGGNEAIELPSVEEIIINECRNMEAFSYGSVSTPKLKKVILNYNSFDASSDALNALVKEYS